MRLRSCALDERMDGICENRSSCLREVRVGPFLRDDSHCDTVALPSG